MKTQPYSITFYIIFTYLIPNVEEAMRRKMGSSNEISKWKMQKAYKPKHAFKSRTMLKKMWTEIFIQFGTMLIILHTGSGKSLNKLPDT